MSSRAGIKNYDIAYKLSICEEYLKCIKANPKLTKKEYASSKGIKASTFADWINAYNQSSDNEIINTSSTDLITVPKFVKLSDDVISKNIEVTNANKVTLKYKDVALEFDSFDLEKALEIIKRW